MTKTFALKTCLYACLACLLVGAGLGVWITLARTKPVTAKAEPQINLPGGAVALEVVPDAHAKPPHALPAGSKANRTGNLTLKPLPTTPEPATGQEITARSKDDWQTGPIKIDWTLADMPDGTQRMVFSSPDAEITGGVDHPVLAARKSEGDLVHAIGGHYGIGSGGVKTWGPSYEYDWKRLRVGVDLSMIERPTMGSEFAITGRLLFRLRGRAH